MRARKKTIHNHTIHSNYNESKHLDKPLPTCCEKRLARSPNNQILTTHKNIPILPENKMEIPIDTPKNADSYPTGLIKLKEIATEEEFKWPVLTIKNINTTFKVIGDLTAGSKVKVVDDRCLAVDDAYLPSISRIGLNNRKRTMSYLEHLLLESKRIAYEMLTEIRHSYVLGGVNNNTVNNKISELRNFHRNLNIFLHKFDTIKFVYKSDSEVYSALSDTYNNFCTFEDSFYRQLVLGNS